MHIDEPQSFWEDELWTDETKLERFGDSHQLHVHRHRKEHLWKQLKHAGWRSRPSNLRQPERFAHEE